MHNRIGPRMEIIESIEQLFGPADHLFNLKWLGLAERLDLAFPLFEYLIEVVSSNVFHNQILAIAFSKVVKDFWQGRMAQAGQQACLLLKGLEHILIIEKDVCF